MKEVLANIGDRTIYITRSVKLSSSQIKPNTWNFNAPTPRESEAIQESVAYFGQILEIVVRPFENHYQIIDGEQRSTKLPQDVYCHIVEGFTDAECIKLSAVLNLTKGTPSLSKLGLALKAIAPEFGDDLILALPYTNQQVEQLMLGEVAWDKTAEGGSGAGEDGWTTFTIKASQDLMDILNQGRELISQDVELPEDKAIAWGLVFGYAIANYLAG